MSSVTDSKAQQLIALSVVPTLTGGISALASGTILYSILNSKVKLKVPYRRLVFALSLFDLICSVAYATSSWVLPTATAKIGSDGNEITSPQLSFGTQTTCEAQGFFFIFGYSGSILASSALCIYYYCTLKLNISFRTFHIKIEYALHAFCFLWSMSVAGACLATGSINADRGHCTIKSIPDNCLFNEEVECERGEKAMFYQTIVFAIPGSISFIIIVFVMVSIGEFALFEMDKFTCSFYQHSNYLFMTLCPNSIVCMQHQQESRNRRFFVSLVCLSQDDEPMRGSFQERWKNFWSFTREDSTNESPDLTVLQADMRRRSIRAETASRRRERRVRNQAFLYIFGYLITQLSAAVVAVGEAQGKRVFGLDLLRELLFPLQGFINILVYTYPHVSMMRKSNPSFSYLWAFYAVLRSGGDHDEISGWRQLRRTGSLRRGSTRSLLVSSRNPLPNHVRIELANLAEIESTQRNECASLAGGNI